MVAGGARAGARRPAGRGARRADRRCSHLLGTVLLVALRRGGLALQHIARACRDGAAHEELAVPEGVHSVEEHRQFVREAHKDFGWLMMLMMRMNELMAQKGERIHTLSASLTFFSVPGPTHFYLTPTSEP